MKTQRLLTSLALLFGAMAAQAQRSYAWQNHPVAKELSKTANGAFPDIQDAGFIALALTAVAGLIWLVYFRACWREAHDDLHNGALHYRLRPHTGENKEWSGGGHQESAARTGGFARPNLQAAGGKAGPKKR